MNTSRWPHVRLARAAKVGDVVLIEGGGSTYGLTWQSTVKRVTRRYVEMESGLRFDLYFGWPVPRGANYAEIKEIIGRSEESKA